MIHTDTGAFKQRAALKKRDVAHLLQTRSLTGPSSACRA